MQRIVSNYKKFVAVILLTNLFLQSCGYTNTENEARSIALNDETIKRFDYSPISRELEIKKFAIKQNIFHKSGIRKDVGIEKTKKIIKNKKRLKAKKRIKKCNILPYSSELFKLEQKFFKNREDQTSFLCIEDKNLAQIALEPELYILYKYERNIEEIKQVNETENRYSKESEQIQTLKNRDKDIVIKNKKYQLATIDRFSDKEACFFKTIARGNYPIEFFPQENNWMARVVDNITPNFTRIIILPVLYAVHQNKIPYTIESIFSKALERA